MLGTVKLFRKKLCVCVWRKTDRERERERELIKQMG